MRLAFLSLLGLLAATPVGLAAPGDDGGVKSEEHNFELSMPDSLDWEKEALPADRKSVRAHFRTEFADSEPRAFAETQLIVAALGKQDAKMSLESIAKRWAGAMEGSITNPRELKEGKTTLGGHEAYYRDVQGDYVSGVGHITWYIGRMGKKVYVLWSMRAFLAIDDEDIEDELKEIRESFKYLKVIKVEADKKAKKATPEAPAGQKGGAGEVEVDPDDVKRVKVANSHWRFECYKPEELFQIDPKNFEDSEKANNVVAKFERRKGQTYLMIRVYAQSTASQRYTIEQIAERNLKSFHKIYKEKMRLEPEIDKNYKKKFPLAKEAIKMKLVGRRTVPETTYWYLAQCKNDRQYHLQIYITGATGEKDWEKQTKDFMKSFKPTKK